MRRSLHRQLDANARRIGEVVERELHREAESWPYATGYTSERIDHHVRSQGTDRIITFRSASIHGDWREKGTKPHRIVARRAPALVFYWRRVGRVVAFRSVNHPGQPKRPWFGATIRRTMRSFRLR